MLNDKIIMLACARLASEICGVPAEWIYSQWAHESTNVTPGDPDCGKPFRSALAREQFNFGGLTQEEENDTPQPDGRFYYMKFASPEEYADYFGRYIKKYFPTAAAAQTLADYAHALKHETDPDTGEEYAYYGDSEENYLAGTLEAYKEAFDDV